MFVEIAAPHAYPIMLFTFYKGRQIWDRSFSCDITKTKKKIQSKYEKLYIGPEFTLDARLGQIIALFWVTFFFMPAIPTLFMIMSVNFILMFWIDKYLLLRFYRTPRNYDEKTIIYTVQNLKWAFVLHGILGAFMLSNQSILSSKNYFAPEFETVKKLTKTYSGGKLLISDRFA